MTRSARDELGDALKTHFAQESVSISPYITTTSIQKPVKYPTIIILEKEAESSEPAQIGNGYRKWITNLVLDIFTYNDSDFEDVEDEIIDVIEDLTPNETYYEIMGRDIIQHNTTRNNTKFTRATIDIMREQWR